MRPLEDRVIIVPDSPEEITPMGLHVISEDAPSTGKVVAVGPGRYEGDRLITPGVWEGDRVLYAKYAGTEHKDGDRTVRILNARDILAVL